MNDKTDAAAALKWFKGQSFEKLYVPCPFGIPDAKGGQISDMFAQEKQDAAIIYIEAMIQSAIARPHRQTVDVDDISDRVIDAIVSEPTLEDPMGLIVCKHIQAAVKFMSLCGLLTTQPDVRTDAVPVAWGVFTGAELQRLCILQNNAEADAVFGNRSVRPLYDHPAPQPQELPDFENDKEFIFDPATAFIHANDGGAPENGIRWVRDEDWPQPAAQSEPTGDLYICQRKEYIANHEGGTSYETFEPVRRYDQADAKPAADDKTVNTVHNPDSCSQTVHNAQPGTDHWAVIEAYLNADYQWNWLDGDNTQDEDPMREFERLHSYALASLAALRNTAAQPEGAEPIQGLAEAIEWADLEGWIEYGIDAGIEIKNPLIIKWHEALIKAARAYLALSSPPPAAQDDGAA